MEKYNSQSSGRNSTEELQNQLLRKDLEQSHTFYNRGEPNNCKRFSESIVETVPSNETPSDHGIRAGKNELHNYFLIHQIITIKQSL